MQEDTRTERERQIYDYIVTYRQNNYYTPSMKNIADAMNLHSTSVVHRYVHALVDKGWLMDIGEGRAVFIPMKEYK